MTLEELAASVGYYVIVRPSDGNLVLKTNDGKYYIDSLYRQPLTEKSARAILNVYRQQDGLEPDTETQEVSK